MSEEDRYLTGTTNYYDFFFRGACGLDMPLGAENDPLPSLTLRKQLITPFQLDHVPRSTRYSRPRANDELMDFTFARKH